MKKIIYTFFFLTTTLCAQNITNIENYYEVIKTKLGPQVNSAYYEGAPILSPDGEMLWFYRAGHPENKGANPYYKDEDIWYTNKVKDKWSYAKNVGYPLNNKTNSGVCGTSSDGNILYVYDFYNEPEFSGLAITYKTAMGYIFPKHIKIENFYMKNNLVWFHVSADGKVLLMSLERNETEGMSDIYISLKKNDGTYSKPQNLGKNINSNLREISPFLAPDNKTLYYASEGKPGYGNFDIFVSKRLDDTWLNWSTPQNLGPKVNSNQWDSEFSISADGKDAFMVSGGFKYGDNTDIYHIKLPISAMPQKQILVQGYLKEYKTNKPLEGIIKFYKENEHTIPGIAYTNPENGFFKIHLEKGVKYFLQSEKQNYFAVVDEIQSETFNDSTNKLTLYLAPIIKGTQINLSNINFDRGDYKILGSSEPQLIELLNVLSQHPNYKLNIIGHTETIGNPNDNLTLSTQRANEVKKWFIAKGINSSRLKSSGKGGAQPLYEKNNPKHYLNRRVEFIIEE